MMQRGDSSMKFSSLKEKMQAGQTVYGTFVSLPEAGVVEIIGAAGYDFALIDLEHTPIDFAHLRNMIAAADAAGTAPVVRVGTVEANPILRVVDSGAFGVAASHVRNRDEALALVRACRYPPLGIRGVAGATRAAEYGKVDFRTHVAQSNEQVLTIALIEDYEGVEAIEEIVAVEGLDLVFPGPGDLSASMGFIGQMQHPAVQEAVDRIAEAVHARPGLELAYQIMEPAQIGRCRQLDARMIIFSQESRVLYRAYLGALEEMKQDV
jgi:4-hydroxy-2-oxoheptanedioate aldolase